MGTLVLTLVSGVLGVVVVIIFLVLVVSINSNLKTLKNFWMKSIGTELEKHTRILERIEKKGAESPVTPDAKTIPIIPDTKKTIRKADFVVCCRCDVFMAAGGFCPSCGTGSAGKKIGNETWEKLRDYAKREALSIRASIDKLAVCSKCGELRSQGTKCPHCD